MQAGEVGQQEPHAAQQREMPIFLRRNKCRHQYMLGAVHVEKNLGEKDMGVLGIMKLTVSEPL